MPMQAHRWPRSPLSVPTLRLPNGYPKGTPRATQRVPRCARCRWSGGATPAGVPRGWVKTWRAFGSGTHAVPRVREAVSALGATPPVPAYEGTNTPQ